MAFLHAQSCECIKSELDLFALPATQTSIEGGEWVFYKPLSSLSDDAPIEFVVPGNGNDYLDLSHTMLYVTAKIVQQDDTPLGADDVVAPVNNWLHTMYSQVEVCLNQKLVSPPSNTYAYRAYIETLLNYGSEAKATHLGCSLWHNDTPKQMDTLTADNKGFAIRQNATKLGKMVEMVGHVHADLFNQEKFLINGVEMKVKFVRSRDTFSLMAAAGSTYKVKVVDASLLVRRMKINPVVLLAHTKALETTAAKYPITRSDVKVLTIPAGVQRKSLDNVFLGQLPKRCIIGFVSNKAFNGEYASNPFNFHHYKINYMSLYIDGQQIPSKPLQPDFTQEGLYVRAYHTLFSGSGIHFLNEGNNVSRLDYPHGYCLMTFDLTPDLSANATTHWNLVKNGSLRIEVGFQDALTETVNCLVYAEFDNVIEIDKHRNVIADFNI
ncbi:uncharacterized protein F54H12.2-like [Photinus pyralis]|uniref:uncharacterized protein F54H12.2-like n=1 Tax=Photinus pyralis TaxID=7054 RepID=UPI00126717D0|nr:uncharacterized protein F54H12.2-like [Photinus pyralis]